MTFVLRSTPWTNPSSTAAGAASGLAAHHANFLGFPVDLWIVFLEPGVTEDDVLLTEPSHGELDMLGMSLAVDHHIDYAGHAAHLGWGAIHIENWDGLRELLDPKVTGDGILRVDKVSGHSTVNQNLHQHLCSGPDRLQVQQNVQGVPALNRIDDVLPGELLFPLRVMNTLE
jgi:hypothetical protein